MALQRTRRSARLQQQRPPREEEEEHMRIAMANSLVTFDEEQRQCADLSHLDDVKLDATQFTVQVFCRRKRPRQDEDEEPPVSNGGNDENPAKSRTLEDIVESTEVLKDAPAADRPAGKSKSKTSKRQKALKRLIPSTKKKKKKDLVRSYFGFSAPGKLEEPSPEGSNEEVFVVDDEDHLQDSEPQLKRCGVTFAYPSRNDPEAVEVEEQHLQCLAEQEYVNDTIIDLYIKYIQVSQSTALDRFHVFNSFFFKRLAQAVCDENFVESVGKLRKWTKGIDIYDKAYVLMPVHQQLHWSLVVVCFSGPKPGCHILHLDSMKTGHISRPIYEVVRRYLLAEWISHGGENKAFKNVHERKVKVPKQPNEYDCGLFMLHFIQQFLSKAPASFSDSMVKDMPEWFSLVEASKLRTTIRDITDKIFFPKEGKEEPTLDSDVIDGATKPEPEQDPSAALIDEAKDVASSAVEGSNGENTTQQPVTSDDPANVPSNEEITPPGNEILADNDPSSNEEITPAGNAILPDNDPPSNGERTPAGSEMLPGNDPPSSDPAARSEGMIQQSDGDPQQREQ